MKTLTLLVFLFFIVGCGHETYQPNEVDELCAKNGVCNAKLNTFLVDRIDDDDLIGTISDEQAELIDSAYNELQIWNWNPAITNENDEVIETTTKNETPIHDGIDPKWITSEYRIGVPDFSSYRFYDNTNDTWVKQPPKVR